MEWPSLGRKFLDLVVVKSALVAYMVEFALVRVVMKHRAAVDSKPARCLLAEAFWKLHQMVIHEPEHSLKPDFSGTISAH